MAHDLNLGDVIPSKLLGGLSGEFLVPEAILPKWGLDVVVLKERPRGLCGCCGLGCSYLSVILSEGSLCAVLSPQGAAFRK